MKRVRLLSLVAAAAMVTSAAFAQDAYEPDVALAASWSMQERQTFDQYLTALRPQLPALAARSGLSQAALENLASEVFATRRNMSQRAFADVVATGSQELADLIAQSATEEDDPQLTAMRSRVIAAAREGRLREAGRLNDELMRTREERIEASQARSAADETSAQGQALARDLVRSAGLARASGDYAAAASFFGRASEALPEVDIQERWAARLNQVVALRTQATRYGGIAELRAALDVADRYAAPLAPRATRQLAWASTQMERGIILQAMGERGDREALGQAIEAYRNALTVQQRERTPIDWAHTQGSLGAALITRGTDGDPRAYAEAIEALEGALTVLTPDRYPDDWATSQQNLALAHMNAGADGDVRELRQAITMFDALLAQRTLGNGTRRTAQVNLCTALWQLGQQGDRAAVGRAVRECRAALALANAREDRNLRAMALIQLGNALSFLAEMRNDPRALAESISSYEEAQTIVTREDDFENWTTLRSNLASSLLLDPSPANLQRAETLLNEVSAAYEPRRGRGWAEAQTNLGLVYSARGDAGDAAAYARAVAIYDGALGAISQTGVRRLWNSIQMNRASALVKMAGRGDMSARERAVASFEAVIANSPRGDHDWVDAHFALGAALLGFGQENEDATFYRRAVDVCAAGVAGARREDDPILWAQLQTNLGNALSLLSRQTHERGLQERALAAYAAALTVRTREADTHAWARLQANIAYLQADRAQAGVTGARDASLAAADAAADAFHEADDMRSAGAMLRLMESLREGAAP